MSHADNLTDHSKITSNWMLRVAPILREGRPSGSQWFFGSGSSVSTLSLYCYRRKSKCYNGSTFEGIIFKRCLDARTTVDTNVFCNHFENTWCNFKTMTMSLADSHGGSSRHIWSDRSSIQNMWFWITPRMTMQYHYHRRRICLDVSLNGKRNNQ